MSAQRAKANSKPPMPRTKNLSIKNPSIRGPELYGELREDGASEQKAARISNAAAKDGRSTVGRRRGKAGDENDWTVVELQKKAKDLGLSGWSKKISHPGSPGALPAGSGTATHSANSLIRRTWQTLTAKSRPAPCLGGPAFH